MEAVFSQISDSVHILDVSAFFLILILGELSKRIGEVLRVPHFYHYYYTCAILLIILVVIDMVIPLLIQETDKNEIRTTTMALRAGLVLSTFPVAMIYWRWLFSENMKR
jgi:hypothetical protein